MLKVLFSNRLFIGALAFFVLMVVSGTLYLQHVKRETDRELAETQERIKVLIEKQPPNPTEKVPIGDTLQGEHFHADGTWHDEPHAPVEVSEVVDTSEATAGVSDTSRPAMQLTYHAELLKSNPVEALRQQARELGHWSADHIPPFPPDDIEAAEFARNTYLFLYYMRTRQTDHPEYLAALEARGVFYRALRDAYEAGVKTPWEAARHHDLMKITWTMIEPFNPNRLPTTFTAADGINPESARPLFPFELDRHSDNPMTDR